MNNDFARAIRQDFLRNIDATRMLSNEQKAQQRIAELGKAWILHPEYNRAEHPEHSTHGSEHLRVIRARAVRASRI